MTYERLVDATLPHGLMPLVVPQLKTITLGGAVAGLGIESSSFRNGLPHESVREMEVLTGDGRVVVATARQRARRPVPRLPQLLRHARLRAAADASSWSRCSRTCGCGTCASPPPRRASPRWTRSARDGGHDGEPVDFVDGTVFGPDEQYLTLGTFVDDGAAVSDYTGMEIYYRSIQRREVDHLTVRDYLWRWDTDWFWCSRAFGVQHPLVRRLWPRRYRRSDVYRRLVALRPPAPADAPRWPGCAAGRRRSRSCRTSRCRSTQTAEVPRASSTARSASRRSGCARCGCAAPHAVAALPARAGRALRQRRASGPACRCGPGQPDGHPQPADRGRR